MFKELIYKICHKIVFLSQKASLRDAESLSGCKINFVSQGYGGDCLKTHSSQNVS